MDNTIIIEKMSFAPKGREVGSKRDLKWDLGDTSGETNILRLFCSLHGRPHE